MTWKPFGASPTTHASLTDGTPDWMLPSLRDCFRSEFRQYIRPDYGRAGYHRDRVDRLRRMELETRMRPLSDLFASKDIDAVFRAMTPDERLRTLDWVIRDNIQHNESGSQEIERVLRDGGSKWKVGTRDGVPGLEERVPAGVQDAADSIMSTPGQPGQLLSEAWHSAFGVSPDAEEAYEKAIKAVEEAGVLAVSPKNKVATLGTMVRDMKAQGDWKLPLGSPEADAPVHMAEALWQGQESRHGGNGYRKPTSEEAEAAVLLAVPLVQWFTSGLLARR